MTPSTKRLLLLAMAAVTLLLAACIPPPPPPPDKSAAAPAAGAAASKAAATVAGDVNAGKALFASKGCVACHVAAGVPGAVGTIGPNLNGIGDPTKRPKLADGADNSPGHIREWIKEPQKLKPGTMMPALGLTDKESDDLTAFLVTLK